MEKDDYRILGLIGLLIFVAVAAVFATGPSTPAGSPNSPAWECAVREQNVVAYDSFSQRTFCIDPKNKTYIRELTEETEATQ